MKKFLLGVLCALSALLPLTAAAQETSVCLGFTLDGSGSATVSVTDADGAALDGVSATVSSTHAFRSATGAITSSILCPAVNFNTSPTVTLTFTIEGLDASTSFNSVGLDLHALNGAGNYQENSDGVTRQFNFELSTGSSTAALTSFASQSDIDLAAGVGTKGDVHQVWQFSSTSAVTASSPLVVSVTVTKGSTNGGCFMGLSALTLSTVEVTEPAKDVFPNPKAYYYFQANGSPTMYMTEGSDGGLNVTTPDISERQFWQFVPTESEGVYYLLNATTGRYIQSCAGGGSRAIAMGAEPVPFYLGENAGRYRFTSTDCANYDDTSLVPFGLNKDGSTGRVVSYAAGASNGNSWWTIIETDYLYEVQPFEPSAELGAPAFLYSIQAPDGRSLAMTADGTLSWAEPQDDQSQAWYFVGTSNYAGGYLIANNGTGLTLDLDGESQTHWAVFEDAATASYYFRPASSQDEAGGELTVDGISRLLFPAFRSEFAKASQIYELPCGATSGLYIAQAAIDGDEVVRPMAYPLPTISGGALTATSASAPSSWYTIYTLDKASLAPATTFTLSATLSAAPIDGQQLFAYFDWDRDGVFETSQELAIGATVSEQISVPAEAQLGKTRIRLRLTENGLAGAEDDVIGQTLDFVVNVVEAATTYPLSITSADENRGTVAWESNEQTPATITATATPAGNAEFLYWRDGGRIVSTDATYTFTHDRAVSLVAYFSPNTIVVDAIGSVVLAGNELTMNVNVQGGRLSVDCGEPVAQLQLFDAGGKLAQRAQGATLSVASLPAGAYIVSATTTSGKEISAKIVIDK